jgi:hypothetical protein
MRTEKIIVRSVIICVVSQCDYIIENKMAKSRSTHADQQSEIYNTRGKRRRVEDLEVTDLFNDAFSTV